MKKHILHWLLRVRPAFLASALKRMLRIKRRVVETTHGRFFIDPLSIFGNCLLAENRYEPDMIDTLQHLLKEGDTFIDLGANEGYFSILASKYVGESGRVVSIEPQSRLQGVIFKNMSENRTFNISVFQCAISDHVGMATLSLLPDMNSGGSGLFRTTKYRVPTEIVPQSTLSQLLSFISVEKIRLVKIDIEGFEYEAILGSKDLFESGKIEHIALELHPTILKKRGKPEGDILDCLKGFGYETNKECKTLVLSKQMG